MGIVIGALGPSLDELAVMTATPASRFGSVFAVRGLAYLVGSIVAGKALEHMNGHTVSTLASVVTAICLSIVPACGTFASVHVIFLFVGLGTGCMDTCFNTLISWLHGPHVNPWMHALHMTFGIGAFLIPVFLSATFAIPAWSHSLRLGVPFWLSSVATLPFTVALYFTAAPTMHDFDEVVSVAKVELEIDDSSVLDASPPVHASANSAVIAVAHSAPDTRAAPPAPAVAVEGQASSRLAPRRFILLLGFMLFFYVGAEVGYGGWLLEYALRQGILSNVAAASLVAVFWGSLTVGRLIAIPLSTMIAPRDFILVSVACAMGALFVFSMWPTAVTAAWACSVAYGMAIAPIFPCVMALSASLNLVNGSRDTAIMVVCASAGEMLLPLAIGLLFSISPKWMIWVCILSAVAVVTLLGAAWVAVHRVLAQRKM